MKHLAIFATVVAFATVGTLASQTGPANLPERRIAARGAGKAGSQQTNPQQGNADSPQSTPVNIQATDADYQKKADAEQENLDIQRKLEWFTGGLVFVGLMQAGTMIWQAWLLRGTLKAIKVQASHMERQTATLEKSVTAATDQIEMVKSKERAQLRVEFARPDFAYDAKLKGYPVSFRITLDGTTRAYILQDSILVYLSKAKRTGVAWRVFGVPPNLTPENSPYDGQTLIHNAEPFPEVETDMNKFHFARAGQVGYTLFAEGTIWYRDIFGDEWMLEIDRYWDLDAGMWGPVGSGRYDTHRKVEPYKKEESEKTN
jgi:hypothetical protein